MLELIMMDSFTAGPPAVIQDRYILESWLGKSAVGTAYHARDSRLSRTAVVTFLDSPDSASAERFLRAARLAARLSHPHILSIYDAGSQDGWPYLVLEDIPGGDLVQARLRSGGTFPINAALPLAHSAGGEITWTVTVPLPAVFTAREQEVLQCLVEGLSNKQIAARLVISPRTVNYHLDNIFSRLGVRSRTEAALLALRQGFARRPTGQD